MNPKPLLVLVPLLSATATAQDDDRLSRSRDAAMQLGQELSATLLAAIGTDGPVEAIGLCNVEASPIAARVSEQAGAEVGRTALRLRNPANAPDADARVVLTTFERDLAAGATPPLEHFETRPDGTARYMSAIVAQPLCLTCHGSDIAPDVAATVAEHFPDDRATGFAAGDLRGAFIIEWPAPGAPSTPALQPGDTFVDTLNSGGQGPEMVVIPAGSFRMGCVSGPGCYDDEFPVRDVAIPQAFAISKYEVTFEDYDRFAHPDRIDDHGWGRGRRPVMDLSWNEAREYAAWLSRQTGRPYRLLSEAEWEYAARAGASTAYSWGNDIGSDRAVCHECGSQWDDRQTAPAGSFQPNAFGVHDLHGNVHEWVEDCWQASYAGAPSDGAARLGGDCSERTVRGGSWRSSPRVLRSSYRDGASPGFRSVSVGFRVALTLTP